MVLEVQCFSTQSCVSQGRKPRWTKSNSTNATRSINAITRVVYSVEGLLTINCIAPEKNDGFGDGTQLYSDALDVVSVAALNIRNHERLQEEHIWLIRRQCVASGQQ